jgi:beta-lactamase class A
VRRTIYTRRTVARGLVTALVAVAVPSATRSARAGSLDTDRLERELRALAAGFDGRVGACVRFGDAVAAVNRGQRFPMQSVVKLVVAAATLDAVDRRGWRVTDPVLVRREDLSLFFQPIADLVTDEGYQTTLGDLIVRAVSDSDSAANDILFRRLGGAAPIQAFLSRNGIAGIRVDRQERDLQTEIAGIVWRPEYVDPAVLQQAMDAVPPARADAAFAAALTEDRDTATPEGMAELLQALASGALLSPASTAFLLAAMERTWTGPDRLAAGLPANWTLGHKTGTGTTRAGVNLATNDVGILTAPDGARIVVVAFVSGSAWSAEDRAALIAAVAAVTADAYS